MISGSSTIWTRWRRRSAKARVPSACEATVRASCCRECARASNRWRRVWARTAPAACTRACIISLRTVRGAMTPCWRRCAPKCCRAWWRTGRSASPSSTTPECRRRASTRWAWRGNTAARSARWTIVRCWSACRWLTTPPVCRLVTVHRDRDQATAGRGMCRIPLRARARTEAM
jgi:hypothetical protein